MNRKKSSKAAAVIDIGSNMIKMGISQYPKRRNYPIGLPGISALVGA